MHHYERTCGDCGHHWPVSLAAGKPRRRFLRLFASGASAGAAVAVDPGQLGQSVAVGFIPGSDTTPTGVFAAASARDALRHCPYCGSTNFTQVRRPGDVPG